MKLTISVPKPCHENWEAMTPAAKGRHCAQCDHIVADLTRATDAELVALFSSDARPKCARFDPRQLDRVMSNEPPQRASAIPVAAFTTLLAVASGSEAIAQSGPPPRMGEVAPQKVAPAVKGNAIPHSIPAPPKPTICIEVEGVVEPLEPIPPTTGDTVITVPLDPVLERIETGNVSLRWEEEMKSRDEAERIEQLRKDSIAAAEPLPETIHTVRGQARVECEAPADGIRIRGNGYCYIDGVKVPASAGTGLPASAIEEVQVITGGIPVNYGDGIITGTMNVAGEAEVFPDTVEICGRLQDAETNEPLIFAPVRVGHGDIVAQTDENGDFKLRVPVRKADDLLVLYLSYVGYEGRTAEVFLKTPDGAPPIAVIDAPLTPEIDPRDPHGLSGFVRDAVTNGPLPQAVVRIKGSSNAVRCDAEGRFFLQVDDATNAKDFELEIVDPGRGAQVIPLHARAVPCCVPVQFTPTTPLPAPARDPNACIDVGVLQMRSDHQRYVHTVGMLVVTPVVSEHSGWKRLTAPLRRTWQKLLH